MLCINPRCRATLTAYQWGEGYCSGECMEVDLDRGESLTTSLHDPTGQYTVASTLDEIDAMLEAAEIDPRLPRIIYLRKRRYAGGAGHTFREIGESIGVTGEAVAKIVRQLPRKLLRRCGLRTK